MGGWGWVVVRVMWLKCAFVCVCVHVRVLRRGGGWHHHHHHHHLSHIAPGSDRLLAELKSIFVTSLWQFGNKNQRLGEVKRKEQIFQAACVTIAGEDIDE